MRRIDKRRIMQIRYKNRADQNEIVKSKQTDKRIAETIETMEI